MKIRHVAYTSNRCTVMRLMFLAKSRFTCIIMHLYWCIEWTRKSDSDHRMKTPAESCSKQPFFFFSALCMSSASAQFCCNFFLFTRKCTNSFLVLFSNLLSSDAHRHFEINFPISMREFKKKNNWQQPATIKKNFAQNISLWIWMFCLVIAIEWSIKVTSGERARWEKERHRKRTHEISQLNVKWKERKPLIMIAMSFSRFQVSFNKKTCPQSHRNEKKTKAHGLNRYPFVIIGHWKTNEPNQLYAKM